MMGRCSVGARVIKDRLIPWIMMIMRVEGYFRGIGESEIIIIGNWEFIIYN